MRNVSSSKLLLSFSFPYVFMFIFPELAFCLLSLYMGFPGGSDGKESACNVGDLGSIPGLGRSSFTSQRTLRISGFIVTMNPRVWVLCANAPHPALLAALPVT